MRALIAVLALCPGYSLQLNGGHSNKPAALKSHLEQTVLSEPPAPASATNAATKGASTAAPSVVPRSRVTPTKADVAADDDAGASALTPPPLPKDAKNNVLKWAKNKPCAFTPAALEPTGQRSYKDETDFPELALKYWADPRIHGWGNVGSSGAVHAFLAPTRGAASFTPSTRRSLFSHRFTAGLDAFAYGGLDTRNAAWDVVDAARAIVGAPPVTNCVDLGTGTGATARSLRKRYQASVVGVDTSPEMLRAARDLTNTGSLDFCNDVTYKRHNAEATGLAGHRADVVSVFFLLHEAPAAARRQILREGFRLLAPGGTLALCDIHPAYNPSPIMLSGEPYLNGYLDKIDFEAAAAAAKHGLRLHREVLVEGRLVLWTFQKAP